MVEGLSGGEGRGGEGLKRMQELECQKRKGLYVKTGSVFPDRDYFSQR